MKSSAAFRFDGWIVGCWLATLIPGGSGVWADQSAGPAERQQAAAILDAAGVSGGLVVHVGCGVAPAGGLTAALRAGPQYLVHGLDTDPAKVAQARGEIRSGGMYGPVSVACLRGPRLPYADNLVNLAVVSGSLPVERSELLRVLAPGGAALWLDPETGQPKFDTLLRKPWPAEIDQWTHWLHDASGNAVARDTRVGPPQRMQWVADPLWSRGHEVISSVGAVVSAGGRIVYAVDEGQAGIYVLPARWTLAARDAFNGVLLWKRPIPNWNPPVTLGGFNTGFRPRRLVMDGGLVYLPLGEDGVLTALDAASGETRATLPTARRTTDILCADGLLVAACQSEDASARSTRRELPAETLIAARADTLQPLWQASVPRLASQTVALQAGRIFFRAGRDLVALDANNGQEVWRKPLGETPAKEPLRGSVMALMVHAGTVYVQDGNRLAALRANDGEPLWERPGGGSSKGELFAAGGLLWCEKGNNVTGYDPASGQLVKSIDASEVFSRGHHPRCYRCKATDSYVITNNRGAEFVSLNSDAQTQNDWLRGNCGYGVMPANGLLYAPPNQCFCYGGVMLTGFKALAPGPVSAPTESADDPARLERGPAYGDVPESAEAAEDWPMYRHDARRLGSTSATVSASVAPRWTTDVGGRLTPPVIAGGRVLVAARDAHTVHAFDAQDGRPQWLFTAGGRIDSPPTIHRGRVLFGCADGWVYCLRAADGELAWRFRAAPEERCVGAFGGIESAWPVHGSVLVLGEAVYLTAGRATYLDGGLYAYALDPRTGRVLHHARLSGETPACGETPSEDAAFVPAFHTEGARSDLLVTDGAYLYLGPLKLDARLQRQPTPYIDPESQPIVGLNLSEAPYVDTGIFQAGLEKKRGTDFPSLGVLRGPMGDKRMGLRMFATGGFLDDSGYNRVYWMYTSIWPGYYIAHLSAKAGQLIVADERTTYAVQYFPSRTIHSPAFTPGTKGYPLIADDNGNEPVLDDRARGRDKGMGYTRAAPPKWHQWLPIRVRAMVVADGTLFVAGPPDEMPEEDPYAALEGRRGARLQAISTADGQRLGEQTLDVLPVFDGLAAAAGRLYLATTDGKLVCLGAPRRE